MHRNGSSERAHGRSDRAPLPETGETPSLTAGEQDAGSASTVAAAGQGALRGRPRSRSQPFSVPSMCPVRRACECVSARPSAASPPHRDCDRFLLISQVAMRPASHARRPLSSNRFDIQLNYTKGATLCIIYYGFLFPSSTALVGFI